MDHFASIGSRYAAVTGTLLSMAAAVSIFIWTLSVTAAALDSIPVAFFITTLVLLPLASPLARLCSTTRH